MSAASAAAAERAPPILRVDALEVRYALDGVAIAAVRGVSLEVAAGECLGIVGESGSGKSQMFLAALGLLAGNARIEGSVRFEGQELLGLPAAALNRIRGSRLSMVFQDPMTSLTPHVRIGIQLAEVLVHHAGAAWSDAQRAALDMLERVRVPDARRRMRQYPHELSGGMRQRVMIGISLMCEPKLVIADEPTSALDVTVQAQILALLREVRARIRDVHRAHQPRSRRGRLACRAHRGHVRRPHRGKRAHGRAVAHAAPSVYLASDRMRAQACIARVSIACRVFKECRPARAIPRSAAPSHRAVRASPIAVASSDRR